MSAAELHTPPAADSTVPAVSADASINPIGAPETTNTHSTTAVFPPAVDEVSKTQTTPESEVTAIPPVEESKEAQVTKAEEKAVEPIQSGALGYKAPGLKNAFRYSKKYFWFGEEPVHAANLREYLRGEKPEIAHPVAAWSSQTGKGLFFFVKHADQKENPAGALNLANATDLVKDGPQAFAFKIAGQKHAFEAQSAAERDGWFVAIEKATTDAKEAKEGIESSEGYKEHKEKISKPSIIAGASSSAPQKSTDLKAVEAETAAESSFAAPARAGSSSSSSSDENKKTKKSRSVSRGKRASIFGGLLGKKDKESAKEGEAKAEFEAKKEEPIAAPSETAPQIETAIPRESSTLKDEVTADPVVAPIVSDAPLVPVEETKLVGEAAKTEELAEKPKPQKRSSIFGFLRSPKEEKKQPEFPISAVAKDAHSKEPEVAPLASTTEPTIEPTSSTNNAAVVPPLAETAFDAPAGEPTAPATPSKTVEEPIKSTGTPNKEKSSFFDKLRGAKDRSKSPAAPVKKAENKAEVLASTAVEESTPAASGSVPVATESTPAPITSTEPIAAGPLDETSALTSPEVSKIEDTAESVSEKKDEVEQPKRKSSFFGNLTRSLSKATGKTPKKEDEKKEKEKLSGTVEEQSFNPVVSENHTESAALPTETSAHIPEKIGDVPAPAVIAGEPAAVEEQQPKSATSAALAT